MWNSVSDEVSLNMNAIKNTSGIPVNIRFMLSAMYPPIIGAIIIGIDVSVLYSAMSRLLLCRSVLSKTRLNMLRSTPAHASPDIICAGIKSQVFCGVIKKYISGISEVISVDIIATGLSPYLSQTFPMCCCDIIFVIIAMLVVITKNM